MKFALVSFEDRAIEWFCAMVMLWWGTCLMLPGDLFSDPRFLGFTRLWLSEQSLASFFLVVSTARLVALYINGRRAVTPYIRVVCAVIGALVWAMLTTSIIDPYISQYGFFGAVQRAGPGWGVYFLFGAAELFSVYRAMTDSRYKRAGHG